MSSIRHTQIGQPAPQSSHLADSDCPAVTGRPCRTPAPPPARAGGGGGRPSTASRLDGAKSKYSVEGHGGSVRSESLAGAMHLQQRLRSPTAPPLAPAPLSGDGESISWRMQTKRQG